MNISFGQIIIICLIAILLFGNFSEILKEVAKGIKVFKETLKKDN